MNFINHILVSPDKKTSEKDDKKKTTKNQKPKGKGKKTSKRSKRPADKSKKIPNVIKGTNSTWQVVDEMGHGVSGMIYKVKKQEQESEEYAMKTEKLEGSKRLKFEFHILQQCAELKDPEKTKHFLQCIDFGKTKEHKFLVLKLFGPSLQNVRHKLLAKEFSPATALNLAVRTLDAIADLHALGWLHRNINPGSFVLGLGDRESIFFLDLGFCQSIYEQDGKTIRSPHLHSKFVGKHMFCSRANHNGIDQSRKDDLESWIYMVVDFFKETILPWKDYSSKSEILSAKELFFIHGYAKVYEVVPQQFKTIVDYVNRLTYFEKPDYKYLKTTLISLGQMNEIPIEKEFDWMSISKPSHEAVWEDKSSNSDNEKHPSSP